MSFLVRKEKTPEHVCPQPSPWVHGIGTVWQCDGRPDRWYKRPYEGCGTVYRLKVANSELAGSEWASWVKIEWPPRAPAGDSPTGAKP